MKEFLLEHFFEHAVWIVITFLVVIIAMMADLVTGIRKSRKMGRKLNSRGYKRTCNKALNYFLPMMCLSCIDMLASVVISFPAFTMLFGAYCVFCELKSVLETTHDKEAIRNDLHDIMGMSENLSQLKDAINKLIN